MFVDLNADMGESFGPGSWAVTKPYWIVTSANVACGFRGRS